MKDETKLFYDLTAEKTADEWYKNDILLPTIKDFFSLLPAKPRILDLGCGPGHESMRLESLGAKVVGIDFSCECVKVAKKRCPQCRFEVMNFFRLDNRLGKFDAVFACASLIHVTENLLETVLRNVADLITKKGHLLAIIQDGRGINEDWSTLEVSGRMIRREVHCFNKECLVINAQRAGLCFIREGYLDKSLFEQKWRNYIFQKV